MKKIIISFILVFCFISVAADIYALNKEEIKNSIKETEELYKNDDYEEAIRRYEIMLLEEFYNPYIYYNLSVAYYKNNDIGRASLNLERAIRLSPRNSKFRYNKELFAKLAEEPDKNIAEKFLEQINLMFNLNEITLISLFFVSAFLVLISLYFLKLEKKLVLYIVISAILSVLSLSVFSFKLYNDVILDRYVILNDTPVRNTPSAAEEPAFDIKAGRNVTVVEELGRWINVKLSVDGLTGWIDKNSVEKI